MHRSRLAGCIIDCENAELEGAASFGGAALGMPAQTQEHGPYVALDSAARGVHIEVQTVDHPSRLHLAIESDDVEAEVTRLEHRGAERVPHVKIGWVMEAPTGHRFCIVRGQHLDTAAGVNVWE